MRNFDFSVLCFGAQRNHFHQWRREEVKAARSFQGQKIVRHVINSNSADPKGQSPGPEGPKNEACMRAGCHMGDSCKIPSGSGAHPQLPWRPRNFVTEGTLCVRKNRSVRPGALWCSRTAIDFHILQNMEICATLRYLQQRVSTSFYRDRQENHNVIIRFNRGSGKMEVAYIKDTVGGRVNFHILKLIHCLLKRFLAK